MRPFVEAAIRQHIHCCSVFVCLGAVFFPICLYGINYVQRYMLLCIGGVLVQFLGQFEFFKGHWKNILTIYADRYFLSEFFALNFCRFLLILVSIYLTFARKIGFPKITQIYM